MHGRRRLPQGAGDGPAPRGGSAEVIRRGCPARGGQALRGGHVLVGCPAPTAQHGRGRDEHDPGEQAEQQVGRNAGRQPGARVRAGHAQDAEDDARREADPAGPPVSDHPASRRDPHDEQRPGRGRMRRLAGPSGPDLTPPQRADTAELRRRIEAGEWVVDLRARRAFAAGHVPGTLGFDLDGSFATYLGWLIPWGTPLTLLGRTPGQVAGAQRELIRIGIDRPAAAATGDPRDWPAAWPCAATPSPTSPTWRPCAGAARS